MGGREMLKAKKKLTFFQFFFHGQRRALQLVYSWSITSWPIHSTGLFIVQDYLDFFNSIIFFLIRLSFFNSIIFFLILRATPGISANL